MNRSASPDSQRVWVFFYGTFMSARVLREHSVDCDKTVPASLGGYRLEIRSRSDLVPDSGSTAYGGLAHVLRHELDELYGGLEEACGLVYRPREVTAAFLDGGEQAAVCYLCGDMDPAAADPTYIEEMVACSRELGLPQECTEHIKTFAP